MATGAAVISLALATALGPAAADELLPAGDTAASSPATVPVRQEVATAPAPTPELDLPQARKEPTEQDQRTLFFALLEQQKADAWYRAAADHEAAEAARAREAADEAAAAEAAEAAPEPEAAPEDVAPAPSGAGGGVWDSLAQCESGGDWSINTGNGYYGGLQFSLSTWQAMGGSGLPSENSRSAQIAVAERILASQGWGAWPSCASQLGLR